MGSEAKGNLSHVRAAPRSLASHPREAGLMRRHGNALLAQPGRHRLVHAVEGDVLTGAVARRGDRQPVQLALGQHVGDSFKAFRGHINVYSVRFVHSFRAYRRLKRVDTGPA